MVARSGRKSERKEAAEKAEKPLYDFIRASLVLNFWNSYAIQNSLPIDTEYYIYNQLKGLVERIHNKEMGGQSICPCCPARRT